MVKYTFLQKAGLFFYMKKKSNNLFIDLNSRIKENMANFTVQRWHGFLEKRFLLGNRMRSSRFPCTGESSAGEDIISLKDSFRADYTFFDMQR